MKRTFIKCFLLAFVVCIPALLSVQAWSDDQDLTYSISFTNDELDNLLAPIALYPDPLLAQILPASTYPEEIADAAAWLNSGGDVSGIDEQDWDESVKAVAHYPSILQMMAENMDWTADLGDAFLNQPEDVTGSIQRLRQQAQGAGNLMSTNEQSVMTDQGYIEIIPAQPEYIYVPQYDPLIVYHRRWAPGMPPFITFHVRLAIGGWLGMDFDWGHHDIIHHGWNRSGWVNNARPYVHVTNVYINRSRPDIHQAWRHDASHGDPARYLALHPSGSNASRYARISEMRGGTAMTTRPSGAMFAPKSDTNAYSNRGRESRGIVNQVPTPPIQHISQRPTTPAPSINERPITPTPSISQRPASQTPSVSSGFNQPVSGPERVQPERTPSVTFGGYRGANEAREQSLRGQSSRQSSESVRSSVAPVNHGSAPARGNASRDKQR
ncbi:MAG TPA: DUF3300 domain-containing protein [Nitrospirota bacterium]|nr:DUF3300 domain-containing protein [Nitrospirota bacterium]